MEVVRVSNVCRYDSWARSKRMGGIVSGFRGDRSRRFVLLVAMVFIAAMLALDTWGQVGGLPSAQTRKRMIQAVDKTVQQGVAAKLPPHLSTLLGLSKEEECPVLQGVVRTGKRVQGLDVSAANKNDVVLFVVDETSNDQVLYLTSKQGALRKVVTVEKGEGRVQKITDEDRKAFEKERQFWLDRLAPVAHP
jgi:hypothetical protein